MPTETKNSTAKASRRGRASEAARALKSDWPTTMPARKAPRAMDAPKNSAEPTAMPSARASTARVNRSRVPVRATKPSSQGMSFCPTTRVKATSAASLSVVTPRADHSEESPRVPSSRAGRKHQCQNGEQILHHQPAQRDVACGRMQGAVVGQYAGEYHGARHGNGHAENGPGLPVPAEGQGHGRPQKRGDGDLDNRARAGPPPVRPADP